MGLIHALTGNTVAATAQLDSIRLTNPDHLLATMLEFSIAQTASDPAGEEAAYRRFLDAYETERAAARPEYQAHQSALDAFHSAAQQALGGND